METPDRLRIALILTLALLLALSRQGAAQVWTPIPNEPRELMEQCAVGLVLQSGVWRCATYEECFVEATRRGLTTTCRKLEDVLERQLKALEVQRKARETQEEERQAQAKLEAENKARGAAEVAERLAALEKAGDKAIRTTEGFTMLPRAKGTGALPPDMVKVQYKGWSTDGSVILGSRTAIFVLSRLSETDKCFAAGVRMTPQGGKTLLLCPPRGARGVAMIFDIEVLPNFLV